MKIRPFLVFLFALAAFFANARSTAVASQSEAEITRAAPLHRIP